MKANLRSGPIVSVLFPVVYHRNEKRAWSQVMWKRALFNIFINVGTLDTLIRFKPHKILRFPILPHWSPMNDIVDCEIDNFINSWQCLHLQKQLLAFFWEIVKCLYKERTSPRDVFTATETRCWRFVNLQLIRQTQLQVA